jgi:aldehyde:ferredoxin oxidoreductase
VLFAAVVNDLHRAAGRSGVGAVMGSKNLKAIAVRGTKGVGNLRDPKAFMAAVKASKKVLAENGVTGTGLPAMGTQVLMSVINEIGGLPTRNHQDVQFEGAKDIGAEAMAAPRKPMAKNTWSPTRPVLAAPLPAGASARWTKATSPSKTSPNTGVPMADWNTKPPGRWARPMA